MCLLGRPDTTCSIVYTEDKSKDNACTLYVKLYKQYRTVHIYTYVCFSLSIIVIRFVASVKTILIRYTLFRECKQVGLELVTNHQKCFMILKSRFAITNSCNSFKQLNSLLHTLTYVNTFNILKGSSYPCFKCSCNYFNEGHKCTGMSIT